MRYSFEPKDRIYIKGYGFLSFAKNMGKTLSSKYGQKRLQSAKKSITDAIKTASKRAIQKTAEKLLIKYVFLKGLKNHNIMKQMMNQKHQKKDTYHQKKDNKSLIN